MRPRLLLALVLCGAAHAYASPRVELTPTPAWQGWTRPGRTTEIDVRVTSDTATHATLDVAAGLRSVRAEIDLQPGRGARLHVPLPAATAVSVSVATPDGATQRREVALARSEAPLLGVGLATDEPVALDGFHVVALSAQDLPRHAAAYSSFDALALDAATLGALDPAQLGALLAHAAACGRIVVVSTDERVRRVLQGAGGCGGQALLIASSVADARDRLAASLATSLPAALPAGGIGELTRADPAVWNRVAVALAVYLAAALLAFTFVPSWPVILLVSALASVAVPLLLQALPAPAPLRVWSESESGATVARYQAWQRFVGVTREHARVPIPPQLASSVQPCSADQAVRLDFDAARGVARFAEFDSRLFHQVSLCYSGSFPIARSMAGQALPEGARRVSNSGTTAWPAGVVLAEGLAHDLPALGPGAATVIDTRRAPPRRDAAVRMALTRMPPDALAALWELDLGGVADVPAGSKGWLLMSTVAP